MVESLKQIPEAKIFSSLEEELAYLRGEVARREREMLEREQVETKVETARAVLADYQEQPPAEVLHPRYALPDRETEAIVLNLSPELHDDKMEELLGLLQERGVKNVLGVVEKLADPHLTDDFHRFLAAYMAGGHPAVGVKEGSPLWKTFHMTLYEVVLPRATGEEPARPLKELLSSMEQFYAGMMSLKDIVSDGANHFALEVAVANDGEEFIFYAAVPTARKNLFEKQLLAIFPAAELVPAPNDYNIFNPEGVSVASYAKLKTSSIFPLKTYDRFDYDPLNALLNSFSKTNRLGEGAAIQLIFKPAGDSYLKQYRGALDRLNKGVPLKEAVPNDSVWLEIGTELKKFIWDSDGKKKKEEERSKPVDQLAAKMFEEKMIAPIATVNLRLVASGPSRGSAEAILSDIEAAFNQFELAGGNRLEFVRPEGGKLRELLQTFSFRNYSEDRALPLNLREVTSLIHLPAAGKVASSQLKLGKAAAAPPPTGLPAEGILLGVNNYQHAETRVFMPADDRLRHFYVIGQTGTGKTTLLKNMIAQDIKNGDGVCFIDPHGSDVEDVLSYVPPERYDDLIYFDPSHTARPMGLNMLEYDPAYPEQKTFVVNEMFSIFQKLYGAVPESMGPMFEQYFRNATNLVIEDPASGSTLLDVSRVMSNKAFRDLKLSRCKNPIVVQFWREVAEKAGGEAALANIVPYITSKFDIFLANDIMRPIVAQEQSSLNFRQIMDGRKILLVNLSKGRLGDINAHLIGLIIVGKILMATLSRVGVQHQSPPFYLYIDEFQNVTTDSISAILSEARKYKLSLTMAHQFIAQLEERIRDAVFGNVGSIASFRIGAADAEYLVKQFEPVFSASDLMNIDNRHAYLKLLAMGRPVKPFDIETLPPPATSSELATKLKELSFLKYGRERGEIESAIMQKYNYAK